MKNILSQIDHIGIIVKDLEKSLSSFQKILGIELKEIEEMQKEGDTYRLAFLTIAGVNIELVETSASNGLVADFHLKETDGIHHIAFRADNLEALFTELQGKGARFLSDKVILGSRGSKVAFFRPEEFNGIYIELVEPKKGST